MKKVILLMMLAVICFNTAFSQSQEGKESAFQFTFFPPLGTQGMYASQYSNGVSINLLAGISRNEKFFTLGSIANIVKNDASGFQLAGITNIIGNNTHGFQIAGVANLTRNNAYGFQLSGVTNLVGNNGKGVLLSGVLNASKKYSGFQLAGVGNMAGDMNGSQLSGVGNIARDMNGFQLGGVGNIAGDINGFQFGGVFNKAKKVKGVQFAGLLNIADESDYSIGLINIIKNGEMGIGISYNEIGSTVLSLRSGGRVMYGIIGFGYNHRSIPRSISDAFVFEIGYGAHINCSEKFRINTEAKAQFLSMFKDIDNAQYGLSILPALKLGSNFEVFAGPSINYLRSNNIDNKSLFPKNTSINIWKSFGASRLEQVYIGFSVGTQFIF